MNILALDLATRTGWAIKEGEARVLSGVQEFALARGESPGMRYIRFARWLNEMLLVGGAPLSLSPSGPRVQIVVYEQSFRRGGAATEVAGGLVSHLQAACAMYGIEHVAIPVTTLKKFATGKGNAKKPEMVARAVSRWPEQFPPGARPDDDQADALWILEYARATYGTAKSGGQAAVSEQRPGP